MSATGAMYGVGSLERTIKDLKAEVAKAKVNFAKLADERAVLMGRLAQLTLLLQEARKACSDPKLAKMIDAAIPPPPTVKR